MGAFTQSTAGIDADLETVFAQFTRLQERRRQVAGCLLYTSGSLIAAAALTVLPELLRAFSDYRMLVYAIVLILVMLTTNNPTLKAFFARLRPGRAREKEAV